MHVVSSPATQRQKLLLPILIGGLVAGSLDMISAFISFGARSPQGVAAGLLGMAAFRGGAATWILGLFLQLLIACIAAAIYAYSSLRLRFLRDSFFVCGLFYGIAVFLVMNLIVVPLSAFPFKNGTFTQHGLIQGLLVHMFLIGLPISFSLWKFSE